MGELATAQEDMKRYFQDGFQRVTPDLTARLDQLVATIESKSITFKGWATPGMTLHSAAVDVARTTCRRAERRVHALKELGGIENTEILIFLNRLSDLLWLFARWVETQSEA
jgi:cob(I)alamin adenosyltransferase